MKLIGNKTKLLNEIIPNIMNLDEKYTYILEIKRKIKSRSLKANAYAWELMGQIAEKLNMSKEEVYENMLRDYGTIMTDENGEVIIISSAIELKSNTDLHIAYIGKSYLNNKLFYHYRLIKGSSQYDSVEMYRRYKTRSYTTRY